MVVAGESIIRNLLYGKLDCDKFGGRMMIGYLPDSFGQSAAMPKILNGFGIDKSLFWRGYSKRLGITKTEFLWEADDGSQTTVQLLPINYSVGITIPKDVKKIRERFDEALPVLEQYSTAGDLLVPNGHDQMPVQQDIFEIMDIMRKEYPDYEVKLSSYENQYENIDKNSLYKLKGELLDGKHQRIHRSIYSSRADLKSANTRIENKITNMLEPIASIAYALGFDYQSGTIEQIWREMLKNHAHDSICCCNTDEVNTQVQRRFGVAEDLTDNLTQFYLRKILESAEGEADKLVVVNTFASPRNESFAVEVSTPLENFDLQDTEGNCAKYEILESAESLVRDESEYTEKNYRKHKLIMNDTIPAMGYKIYKIVESKNPKNKIQETQEKIFENKYFKIEINKNGSLNIKDKSNGNVYNQVLLFEDGADAGDSYDFSPIENDFVITSKDCVAEVKTLKGNLCEEAQISLRFEIPKNMESRLAKKIDSYIGITINVQLNSESPVIDLEINVDNQAKDHRLRILVPQNKTAEKSISDIQFGTLERDVYDKALDVWQEENWDERPDTIFPFLNFVHTNAEDGLAVLTNSVREFQIVDGQNAYDTIAITLFRSYGRQGRPDLLRRPGRSSGTNTPTPDAQLIGKQTYQLALTSELNNIENIAKSYTTPIVHYAFDPGEDLMLNATRVKAPQKFSLLETKNSAIVISSLKKMEQGKELCLRLYNTTGATQKFDMSSI